MVPPCTTCARRKNRTQWPSGLLQALATPHRPWLHMAVDYSIRNAKLLVDHAFRLHNIPAEIVSDRGPQFTSQVWMAFCSAFRTKASLSLGYHPQSNSLMESRNQELESTLRCITKHNPATWSTCLPWVEYAQNSLTSSATSLSPFKVSLGYQPPLFPVDVPEFAVASVQHHLQCCRHVWIQNPRYIRPHQSICSSHLVDPRQSLRQYLSPASTSLLHQFIS